MKLEIVSRRDLTTIITIITIITTMAAGRGGVRKKRNPAIRDDYTHAHC